jgi:hypothetical protein
MGGSERKEEKGDSEEKEEKVKRVEINEDADDGETEDEDKEDEKEEGEEGKEGAGHGPTTEKTGRKRKQGEVTPKTTKRRRKKTNNEKTPGVTEHEKVMHQRDGLGPNVELQAKEAWAFAHSPEWHHLFSVLTPVTSQAEFDAHIREALRAGDGVLQLLLIVSRLIRTDTPEVAGLRRAIVQATQDPRAPMSRLDKGSEPVDGGGINEMQAADGFKADKSVVYFVYILTPLFFSARGVTPPQSLSILLILGTFP